MKTLIILFSLFLTITLNAQERIIHSAALKCYIDLEKIAGITDLYNRDGCPAYGYELRYAPYRDWRFTIIYQFRDDYTHQFYADSAKAYKIYYRIVNKWKEYTDPPKPTQTPRDKQIINLLKEDIAWMDSTRPYIIHIEAKDPWSRSIKTNNKIIKLLK